MTRYPNFRGETDETRTIVTSSEETDPPVGRRRTGIDPRVVKRSLRETASRGIDPRVKKEAVVGISDRTAIDPRAAIGRVTTRTKRTEVDPRAETERAIIGTKIVAKDPKAATERVATGSRAIERRATKGEVTRTNSYTVGQRAGKEKVVIGVVAQGDSRKLPWKVHPPEIVPSLDLAGILDAKVLPSDQRLAVERCNSRHHSLFPQMENRSCRH